MGDNQVRSLSRCDFSSYMHILTGLSVLTTPFSCLLYLQQNGPVYDNMGYTHNEGSPPPYSPYPEIHPSFSQEPPSYVETPQTINTRHTVTPGTPHMTRPKKGAV